MTSRGFSERLQTRSDVPLGAKYSLLLPQRYPEQKQERPAEVQLAATLGAEPIFRGTSGDLKSLSVRASPVNRPSLDQTP
jgi:hypothetical protein